MLNGGRIFDLNGVCWDISNEKTFNRDVRGLVSAKQELSRDNGLIISWNTEQLLEQNIMVLPIWKFLLSGDNTDFDY